MKVIVEMCRVHYIRPVYFIVCVKINIQLIAVRKHLYVHCVVIWYRESIYYNKINCLVDLISVLLSLITSPRVDMSLHSDTLTRFRSNLSLLLLSNA
jgi:hypothetical protein